MKGFTILYSETDWFEIWLYDNKWDKTVANILEQYRLSIYPWTPEIMYEKSRGIPGSCFQTYINRALI